jgi:hypothetical protein
MPNSSLESGRGFHHEGQEEHEGKKRKYDLLSPNFVFLRELRGENERANITPNRFSISPKSSLLTQGSAH